jgi:WD40 repeat protein
MEFSPDNNWLLTASSDALMLWNLKDVASTDIDKFVPLVIENTHQVLSISFDRDNKYFLYGDNEQLHIYPIDIKDIYKRLKLKTGRKELNEQEWKYYVKGDLERPKLK